MIEPAYRRDQLWSRPRLRLPVPTLVGVFVGGVLLLLLAVAALPSDREYVFIDDSPRTVVELLVTKLAAESFPAWREHHAGCPHRLSELLSGAQQDPWGHALHNTSAPRLVCGGLFGVLF